MEGQSVRSNAGHFRKSETNEYEKMHLIVDFISGMTDSYAVSL